MNFHSFAKFTVVIKSQESNDKYDEIGNTLTLSGTISKENVQKISNTPYPMCKQLTLMLFIRHCL